MNRFLFLYFLLTVVAFASLLSVNPVERSKNQPIRIKERYAARYGELSRDVWRQLSQEGDVSVRTVGFLLLVGTLLVGFVVLGYGIWRVAKRGALLERIGEPRVPWDSDSFLRLLVLFAFSVFFVQFVLSVLVAYLAEGRLSAASSIVSDIVSKLLLFSLTLLLFFKEYSPDREAFGFSLKRKALLYPFFLLLLALPLIHTGSLFWNTLIEKMGYRIEGNIAFYMLLAVSDRVLPFYILPLLVLLAVVVAPLAEEFVFRSILFTSLRKRVGFWGASLLTSIVFALLHQQIASLVPVFLLSLFLCYLYERTSSFFSAAIMHSTYNGFQLTVFLFMFYRW